MLNFVYVDDIKFYPQEQCEELFLNWINFYEYLIVQKDKEIIELKETIEHLQ